MLAVERQKAHPYINFVLAAVEIGHVGGEETQKHIT